MSSSELALTDVFALDWSGATQYYWGQVRHLEVDEALLSTGRATPRRPVMIEVDRGGRPGDFLWNSHNLVVASSRVVRLFKSGGFESYIAYPVEVRVEHGLLDGYTGVAVPSSAGHLDPRRSRVRWSDRLRPDGTRGIMAIDGLYFNTRNWDGSDLFYVEEFPLQLLMTRKVEEALKAKRVTNYKARPVTEFRFGYDIAAHE